jgi:hypothetical protein
MDLYGEYFCYKYFTEDATMLEVYEVPSAFTTKDEQYWSTNMDDPHPFMTHTVDPSQSLLAIVQADE